MPKQEAANDFVPTNSKTNQVIPVSPQLGQVPTSGPTVAVLTSVPPVATSLQGANMQQISLTCFVVPQKVVSAIKTYRLGS